MSLHPEVLKMIEAGPRPTQSANDRWVRGETPEEFARRIAALQQEISERENAALREELEGVRKDAEAMKAATYSHVDGRDLLHQLQPNGAHHIDILVRINGQDRRYQGDWLKTLTWARDGHNMGEYADNPRLRAMIESRRAESSDAQEGMTGSGIDAAIAQGKP